MQRPPSRPPPRVPLDLRLPNPPPVFAGRRGEALRLRNALARHPVSWVVGAAGLGKTGLVLHVLHRRFRAHLDRLVFVEAAGEPLSSIQPADVARAVARAVGRPAEGPLAVDPESVLDAAEEAGLWVVLDGVRPEDASAVAEFLAPFARYARDSRWVVTAVLPPASVHGELVDLGPMADADLARLARQLDPSLDKATAAALGASAAGSPRALGEALRAKAGPRDLALALAQLAPELRERLVALAFVERPVAAELVAPDDPARTAALVAAGLLEHPPGGYCVAAPARPLLCAVPAARARAAEQLVASEDPLLLLEALRLFLAEGADDRAQALLEGVGARLLAEGQAPRLVALLRPGPDAFAAWLLRAASELAEPPRDLACPTDAAPEVRLAHARVLANVGDRPRAIAVAQALADGQDVPPALAEAAFALVVRCLRGSGSAADALARLEARYGEGPRPLPSEVEHAACLAALGRFDEAAAHARDQLPHLAGLPPAEREAAASILAVVLYDAGRFDEVLALLGRPAPRGRTDPALFGPRRAALLAAAIHADRGHLALAEDAYARAAATTPSWSVQAPIIEANRLYLRLFAGGLGDLDGRLATLVADPQAQEFPPIAAMTRAVGVTLALLRGEKPGEPSPGEGCGLYELYATLVAAMHRARWALSAPAVPAEDAAPELAILAALVEAASAVASQDAASAVEPLRTQLREARAWRFGLREAEARLLLCEALAVAGRWGELAAEAVSLARLSEGMPSARFGADAAFFAWMCREVPDPATLERLAGQPDAGPAAARRARALLGRDAPLDRIDALVVAQAAALPGFHPPRLLVGPDGPAAWGIDLPRRRVWLEDGRELELSGQRVLWSLLRALAARGGRATKEELVLDVWEEREYHPLRHDHRLHVAVSTLRRLLESELGRPARLLTTADGYALAGPVRLWTGHLPRAGP